MPLFLSEDVLAYKNHVFLGVGQSQQKGGEVSRLSVPPPPSRGCPVPPGGWQEGSGGLLQTHGPGPQSEACCNLCTALGSVLTALLLIK